MGFIRPEHEEVRDWWASAPALDEDSLRDGILGLLTRIHDAQACDDWELVQDYIRLYQLGETYCVQEPHRSIYEYGSLGIGCIVAGDLLNQNEYAAAAEKIQEIFERYAARMERYRQQGLTPRPASEARNHALILLADLKWIAPTEWRDFLLTPTMLLVEQRVLIEHVLAYLKDNPGFHPNEGNLRDALALGALGSCKVALRYCPQHLGDAVRYFNTTLGGDLALEPFHYRQVNAARGNYSAYYWDFEISKLRLQPDPPMQDLYMCIELRSLAARSTFGNWKIQGLLRGWRREALAIIRELKARETKPTARAVTATASGV